MRRLCVQVLVPDRKLSEGLLATLALRPEFSLFRSYLVVGMNAASGKPVVTQASVSLSICIFSPQDYNLTDEIERADEFTVFAPTDAAINDHLKNTAVTALVPDTA